MEQWTWIAASSRGLSHERTGLRCQDARSCSLLGENEEILFVVVSDGAGSARYGGEGASLTCRVLAVNARAHFQKKSTLPSDDDIVTWLDAVKERISAAATHRGLQPRDFAATLVCVISNGNDTVTVHVGDGCAVVKTLELDEWIATSWPNQGEYASTTFFVTDDGELKLRITRFSVKVVACAVFTDGIERLALDFRTRTPFQPFFNAVIGPVIASDVRGRDSGLSNILKNFLNSASVNERTDDDKTLILAVRK